MSSHQRQPLAFGGSYQQQVWLPLVHSVVIPSYQSCMIRQDCIGFVARALAPSWSNGALADGAMARPPLDPAAPRDQQVIDLRGDRSILYNRNPTFLACVCDGRPPAIFNSNICKGHTAAEAGKCSLGQLVTPGAADGHLLRRARSIDTRRMPTFHLTRPVLRTDVLLSRPCHQSYVLQLHAVSD